MPLLPVPKNANPGAEVYTALMDAVGTAHMDRALYECANRISRVDEIFGFELAENAAPQPIGWMGTRADASARVSLYAERFHRLDPMVRDLRRASPEGAVFLRSTRASAITDEEYRWYCYDLPGLEEKISVARPTGNGWSVINFYRRDHYDPAEVTELASFAVFALAAIAKHGNLLPATGAASRSSDPAERIGLQLRQRFPALTEREAQVCSHSLLGTKSAHIGEKLGVAQSTILTYRRRAYQRLGISNANALLVHLLP